VAASISGGLHSRNPQAATIANDDVAAARRTVITEQAVRDSAVVAEVKKLHKFKCQACGQRLETSVGWYAQGSHIHPLAEDGPDVIENVLCLCPNHHILFDAYAFTVHDDLTVLPCPGLNLSGLLPQLRLAPGHRIDVAHLRRHREKFREKAGT
jgi:putative restriction endonuclease